MSKKEPTFEEAMERLSRIADELSDGKLPIDKSVALYEEGMRLKAICLDKLNEYERRIASAGEDNANE